MTTVCVIASGAIQLDAKSAAAEISRWDGSQGVCDHEGGGDAFACCEHKVVSAHVGSSHRTALLVRTATAAQ